MKFTPLPLEGAYEVDLERREDARGFFARTYCAGEFSALGLCTEWVQMNLSFTRQRGSLRGLHFQRPPMAEVKLVRAVRGRVLDVIVDLRDGSATYGTWCTVTLDADQRNAIYIPKGFAHGFQTLIDDAELHYSHSTAYAPGHEGGVHPLDPDLAIKWPLEPRNLSERDLALPSLSECSPL